MKKFRSEDKRKFYVMSAIGAVFALAFALFYVLMPKVGAGLDDIPVTQLSDGLTVQAGNVRRFVGTAGVTYRNVTITAANGATIILDNVHVKQTNDVPFITFAGGGEQTANECKIVLVGDSVIESTAADGGSAVIRVETMQYTHKRVDPDGITGETVVETRTYKNRITITDEYDGVNYRGSLTLINAKDSQGAVIGATEPDYVKSHILPPDDDDDRYIFDYLKSGDVSIEGEPSINIIARGMGAAIGGSGIINGGSTSAAGGGNVNISGGTLRIVMTPGSFGTAIGGGSAMRRSGDEYAASTTALAGGGSNVVITGGSLYIEAGSTLNSKKFGTGLGKQSTALDKGKLTDDRGNTLCEYIANVNTDEASAAGGKFTVFDPVAGNYGEFELEKLLGAQDYTYKVLSADYSAGGERQHIETSSHTTVDTEYMYKGAGYAGNVYDADGNRLNVTDISGKLYFYVPADERVFYGINVNNASKEHAQIKVTEKGNPVTQAAYPTRICVDVTPEQYYEIGEVYYINSSTNGRVTIDRDETDDEHYRYYFEMPQGNITIYVETILPSYGITYNNDLGAAHNNPARYTSKDTIVLNDAAVVGMNFVGWYDVDGNRITKIEAGTRGDIVLNARWNEVLYTVTFVDHDGTLIYEQSTIYGGTVTPPEDPERDDYIFTGWDKDFSSVTENITVTATYKYDDSRITLPHNIYVDGSVTNALIEVSADTAYAGEEITVTVTPDPGYSATRVSCLKYRPESNGGYNEIAMSMFGSLKKQKLLSAGIAPEGAQTFIFEMPDYDVEVGAVLEKVTYTITYVNGGDDNSQNPSVYTYGDEIVLKNPVKDGGVFEGWYDADGNEISLIPAGSHGNMVLMGKWKEEVATVPVSGYDVHINKGIKNGTLQSTHAKADKGELVTITANPDRGYKIKSVKYIEADDITKENILIDSTLSDNSEISFYMPDVDIIIIAEFEAIRYNIVYVDTDGSSNPRTYTVEDEFELEIPVKSGYVFDKWYDIDANVVTSLKKGSIGNRIFIATWIKAPGDDRDYTITVAPDIKNGRIDLSRTVAKEGDAVVVYINAANGYKVSEIQCLADETVYPLSNRLYGLSASNAVKSAEEDNMRISGQLTGNEYVFTMPAKNIIVNAVFTYADYGITYIDGGSHDNPDSYTVDDEIVFAPASKDGYIFLGWYNEDGSAATGIEKGSHGTRTLIGRWEKTSEPQPTEKPDDGQKDDTSPAPTDDNTETSGDSDVYSTIETNDKSRASRYILAALIAVVALAGIWFYREDDDKEEKES